MVIKIKDDGFIMKFTNDSIYTDTTVNSLIYY
jgi:hypothetical protein